MQPAILLKLRHMAVQRPECKSEMWILIVSKITSRHHFDVNTNEACNSNEMH